jgi:protein TonB
MFERSLVISQENHASAGQRWTALASITVQVALAGVMIVLPMLHPEVLRFRSAAPPVLMPPLLKLPEVKRVLAEQSSAISSTAAAPSITQIIDPLRPGTIPSTLNVPDGPPVVARVDMGGGGLPDVLGADTNGTGPGVRVVPARTADKPMRVSAGVIAGMLIAPIQPVYPAIAKAAHIEGTVIVEAVISKAGRIESLNVVSGPQMLQRAAIEAIQAARYQPYKLNGEPIEVQTSITVNFRLGS